MGAGSLEREALRKKWQAEGSHGARYWEKIKPVLGGPEGAVPEPGKTDLSLPLVLIWVTAMRINVVGTL